MTDKESLSDLISRYGDSNNNSDDGQTPSFRSERIEKSDKPTFKSRQTFEYLTPEEALKILKQRPKR
ncbi:hypothetical protein LF817_14960 [Halobacillus sp. A1]|uniref:hypothetical protein n=1 Tax=Halobacillus sp. A1 TaxID=2880262 RepID=UPI0020A6BA80|nr:hypothetical protein [Halobacillus sp. A1]MCP3032624.1 hypothetical protein [Halobacillus sp. A1]